MSRPTFRNSPTKRHIGSAIIESGVVANVNVQNMTIDWVSQYSGRQVCGVQLMTPYLHFNNGEGFTAVPEVGAVCMLCLPSDDESPFVLGFLSAPEVENAKSGDVEEEAKDPDVETDEDMSPPVATSSTGSTSAGSDRSDATYRAGRPVLNPGDMLLQGRDENFVVLKRGGVLQIGSTHICQRAYIPLLNYIRDFCENWEMNTAAGTLHWQVHRKEKSGNPENAPTELTLIAREFAQDKNASIRVSLGSLDDVEKPQGANPDKVFLEVVIAPQLIDPASGIVSGSDKKYVLRLDKNGNMYSMGVGTRTVEVKGDDSLSITGNQTIAVTKDRTITVKGKITEMVEGDHTLEGKAASKEQWGTSKTIAAPVVHLGSAGSSEPAVLGLQLLKWLSTHTHPPYAPSPQAATLSTVLSKKIYVE